MRRHIIIYIFIAGWHTPLLTAQSHPQSEFQELIRYENKTSSVRIIPARYVDNMGLSVIFQGSPELHYYADPASAPLPGYELTVSATSKHLTFLPTIYPPSSPYHDPALDKAINVYAGNFEIFLPFQQISLVEGSFQVSITIKGMACTSQICLPPFTETIQTTYETNTQQWHQVTFLSDPHTQTEPNRMTPGIPSDTADINETIYSIFIYLILAVAAGLSINIMPCVLPIIPLIVMRLVEQSQQSAHKRIIGGLAFCCGIILFFAVFALISAIINITTGSVLDLNSLFRYPNAVIVLFLAILFFGLMMLDVVTFMIPSSIAGRHGSSSGVIGSIGMGFFAGILSTPCSGALLGFILVWAQTQPLMISTLAIILMGVGMALPYIILISIPSLLDRIPKPGTWMELFKKSTGFLLFFIAVKITLTALPKERLINVLLYGIIFSFCVWIWGKWVDFSTPKQKKRTLRLIALGIACVSALWLLPSPPASLIAWSDYDREIIEQSIQVQQPVLIKFTADWCTNCKVVDKRVYHDPTVVKLIKSKDVLAIKADTTSIDSPAMEDFKTIYGEAGNIPVTIVLEPDAEPEKLRGIFKKDKLITLLESLNPTESREE